MNHLTKAETLINRLENKIEKDEQRWEQMSSEPGTTDGEVVLKICEIHLLIDIARSLRTLNN